MTLSVLRRSLFALPLLAALALASLPAHAFKLDGIDFADTLRLGDGDLRLNGAGFRAVATFKGYAAGLYLTERASTPAQVNQTRGPKRLQMRMLLDVNTVEFVKAFNKGVQRNTAAAELPALEERMKQFDAQVNGLGKVRKGDVIDLDFLPGSGLTLVVNGKPRGAPIPGDDLYAALLGVFLGERPVDLELKKGLLGARAPR